MPITISLFRGSIRCKVVDAFRRSDVRHEIRVLPCGHYTTGETPYKFIDGWYMGSFVHRAFKALREEKASGAGADVTQPSDVEEEVVSR